MKSDILSVKDVVEIVLKEDERARGDDHWLIISVLRKMGFDIFIPYKCLKDLPSFESITRCRRKFQAEGLYPSSPKIAEKRDEERKEMKHIEEWF